MEDCKLSHTDRCELAAAAARDAGEAAVKKTFAIIGVDIDDPQQVSKFQQTLRFSEGLLKLAEKSTVTFVCALVVVAAGALLIGLGLKD